MGNPAAAMKFYLGHGSCLLEKESPKQEDQTLRFSTGTLKGKRHFWLIVPLLSGVLLGCPPDSYELDFDGSSYEDAWSQKYDLNANFRETGAGDLDVGIGNDQGPTPDVMPHPDMCVIPSTCSVSFTFADSSYTSCEVMGSKAPLSWNPGKSVAMTKSGGSWTATTKLAQSGYYEYKFRCLDGSGTTHWKVDPLNSNQAGDGHGGYNSVLTASCNPCGDGGVMVPDSGPTPDYGPTPDGGGATGFDWRDGVMYFVLLDRFFDGDKSNNKPETGVKTPANWQGGDLAGLLAKIKANYFKDLGVNVLWISCPIDAPDGKYIGNDNEYYTGYHGYWPTEMDKVESRLGTLALAKQVVAEAHSQGIKVIMDYVMNHVHEKSSTYTNNKSWFWNLYKGSGQCICGSNTCGWNGSDGLRCWFMGYLPDFNFQNATARAFSVNNAIKWAKDLSLDGFRLDAVKHIELSWLTDLRAKVKTAFPGKKMYMVGETYTGDKATIKKYVNPSTMLDGQFDFPMRYELVRVILMRQGGFKDLDSFLNANDTYYGYGSVMGTFIGNHDLPRVIHYAEDTPKFSSAWDSGKSLAWYNKPGTPSGSSAYQRMMVGFTALMTLPGVPLIYYGDEVGMAGGGDPDNRRFMQWSGYSTPQASLKAHITKLTKIRAANKALRYGKRTQKWMDNDTYVYTMSYGGSELVVLLNRSDSAKTVKPTLAKSSYTDLLTNKAVTAGSITIPARGSMVLK